MGLASYEIFGTDGDWRIRHDGKAENVYQTKEAAFEAAVTAASLALREGHEVRLTAPVPSAFTSPRTGEYSHGHNPLPEVQSTTDPGDGLRQDRTQMPQV